MHPLDNIIWQALTTRQSHFSEGSGGDARRFLREVSPLAAFREESAEGYSALAQLLPPGETLGVFLDAPYEPQPGWSYVAGAPLLQMVCDNGVHSEHSVAAPRMEELSAKDSLDMIELTALTKPGPFGTRTHEFGKYLGIRVQGKLVAMAGERLRVPGYTEVSAVCTHPDHLGKGYAKALMLEIMRGIRERGETPLLHVRQDNARAVGIYEQLGFRQRKLRHFAVLRRA